MAQYFTNFDEYPVGDVTTSGQTDWTPKISNGTSDYRIIDGGDQDGKFLRVQASGSNGSRVLAFNPLNGVSDNIETLVKFWIFKSGSDGSIGRFGASYTRYGGTTEAGTIGYAVSLLPVSNVKSVVLNEDSTGVVQFANYAWSMSTDYFIRTRISGTLRQVKIWPAASAEPGTWTFESNGTPPTIASPYSGVGTYQGDSYLYVKQYSAGTDGDQAPMFVTKSADQIGNATISAPVPTSTPLGVIGGGYGGTGGYGSAYGHGTRSAFTVEALDQTGNARIERVETATITGNSRIEKVLSTTQTGNARIQKTLNVTRIGNARIEKIFTADQPGNARIEQINSLDQTGNAAIESFFFAASIDQTGNARIQRTESLDQSANARIERVESLDQVGNAFLEWQLQISQQGNAAIILQRSLDQQGNAFIELAKSISQTGNAFIEWQLQLQQSGDARIEKVRTATQTGAAVLIRVDSLDQVGNGRIERTESLTIVGNARITNPSPDKRPQQWSDSDPEAPATWTEEERVEQAWAPAEDKTEAAWESTEDQQPQQWSDSDKPQPTEWQRQYYD